MPRSLSLLTVLLPATLAVLGCVGGDSGEEIGAGGVMVRISTLNP